MNIDPFIFTAWLAGIGISLMSAPLGCFIAWQRLVYFGDSVAHASLLGVVLALSFSISPICGMVAMAIVIALFVATFHHDYLLPSDTLLGIIAHGSLAAGLVILSQSPSITLDVNALLFGDILAVGTHDLITIYGAAFIIAAALRLYWNDLMRFVLHPDIAQVEGVPIRRIRLLLMMLIAVMVAISIKLVGILLITSLLILPAACARLLARSPGQMIGLATTASVVSVTMGLAASLHYDTPTGPTMILAALSLLILLGISRRAAL